MGDGHVELDDILVRTIERIYGGSTEAIFDHWIKGNDLTGLVEVDGSAVLRADATCVNVNETRTVAKVEGADSYLDRLLHPKHRSPSLVARGELLQRRLCPGALGGEFTPIRSIVRAEGRGGDPCPKHRERRMGRKRGAPRGDALTAASPLLLAVGAFAARPSHRRPN